MQKYTSENFMFFYYDSLKSIVDILGKPMDSFMPLDSSTHLMMFVIFNYRSLYTTFHHDFRRRPRYQFFLLFLPGASLLKLDVVSILVDVASFCLAGRKEEPVSHVWNEAIRALIFLRAINVGFLLLFFLMLPFKIFSIELFLKYIHIQTLRKFTVHTWEFVHGPQKKEKILFSHLAVICSSQNCASESIA